MSARSRRSERSSTPIQKGSIVNSNDTVKPPIASKSKVDSTAASDCNQSFEPELVSISTSAPPPYP